MHTCYCTYIPIYKFQHIVSADFFFPGLKGAALGLLLFQHEIRHLHQQAALTAHHPDLLELRPHLALPLVRSPISDNGWPWAFHRRTWSKHTLSLMKLLPRVEVFKQETNRPSVSCVVSMRPKSFGSAMDLLASWATRAFSNFASSAATASLGSRHRGSRRASSPL